MCGSDEGLSPSQRTGKCWGIASLVIGILGCLCFIGGGLGVVGGIGGILMLVAGSMTTCCLKADNAKCIFTTSTVMCAVAAILYVVCIIIVAMALSEVQDIHNEVDGDPVSSLTGFVLTFLYVIVAICAILFLFSSFASYKFLKAMNAEAGAPTQKV